MNSVFKKIKSISKYGIEPIEEGMINFNNINTDIENKAKERAEKCLSCVDRVSEPIDIFKIKDDRIPNISSKMCDNCGCALAYLLRQDIKICKKWNK